MTFANLFMHTLELISITSNSLSLVSAISTLANLIPIAFPAFFAKSYTLTLVSSSISKFGTPPRDKLCFQETSTFSFSFGT